MVTAIIRTASHEHVVARLEKVGIKGLTISVIKGTGEEVRLNKPYSIHNKIEIIVPDEKAVRSPMSYKKMRQQASPVTDLW